MNLRFEETAEEEFLEIVTAYRNIRVSLAEDFGRTVFKRMDQILKFPAASTPISKTVRKANLPRFPYQIFYQVRTDEIWIVAIWHNKRKPGSWKKRKRKA